MGVCVWVCVCVPYPLDPPLTSQLPVVPIEDAKRDLTIHSLRPPIQQTINWQNKEQLPSLSKIMCYRPNNLASGDIMDLVITDKCPVVVNHE